MSSSEPIREPIEDLELARCLQDAYDSPPVPASLQRRLRASVQREFDIPLQQASGAKLAPAFVKVAVVSLRAWPVAAGAAMLLCLLLFVRGDSSAYGWNSMLAALQNRSTNELNPSGLIELRRTSNSGTTKSHWVSFSRGVVGEIQHSPQTRRATIWDYRRGIVTVNQNDQVLRARFAAERSSIKPAGLLLSVFFDRPADAMELEQFSVTDQGWTEAGDGVLLSLSVEGGGESMAFDVVVDRKTHLPQSFNNPAFDDSSMQESARVAFEYPNLSFSERLERCVPADLPVRDVELASLDFGNQDPRAVAAKDVELTEDGDDTLAVDSADQRDAIETPAYGVASLGWKAVKAERIEERAFVSKLNGIYEGLWKDSQVQPTHPAADHELVRRAFLDLVGRTPTVAEIRAYDNQPAEDRYERLIDRLLSSRDHATHIAAVWRSFLLPEGVDLSRFGGTESFDRWMAQRILAGAGYDQIVRELLLAEGRLTQSGPLLFYAACKLDPDKLAARSARVFLGMRLECAQCHDDPFEPFTQEDFWGYAAFFAQISRPRGMLETVSTVLRVHDVDRGEVMMPDTEFAVSPEFLDVTRFDQADTAPSRRQQLASWMTSRQNPYFARATANRVWHHLFGVGIVHPVDGFGQMNEPTSKALLDALAGYLVSVDYDLQSMFRAITLSRAYRLSSGSDTPDRSRRQYFAQMNVKALTAEQVYDCITVATLLGQEGTQFNLERVGNSARDQFIALFRTPAGRRTEYQGGIPQALTLMNGGLIEGATGHSTSGLLKTLHAPFLNDDQRIEILYLATLSRLPHADEWETIRAFVKQSADADQARADILWSLLNSAEFSMNH